MKTIVMSIVLLAMLAAAPNASAQLSQFTGKWKNVDANTRSLTTLQVDVKGSRVRIRAWGKCHPHDCDWGHGDGTVYAPLVEADPVQTAEALSTIYITGFSQTILVIRPAEGGQILAEVLTKFTDQSGRSSIRHADTFSRVEEDAAVAN